MSTLFYSQNNYLNKITEGFSYRYWRLNITDNNGSASNTAVNECELRIALGGASVATGGTASASSQLSTSYQAAYAFNNASTFWVATTKACWLTYDFGVGNRVYIIQFAVKSRPDGYPSDAPKDFQLQWSDDNVNWTTIKSVTGEVSWGAGETRVFTV